MTVKRAASLWLLSASALLLLMPLAARAQKADRERGSVLLGAFITDRSTETRFDSGSGNGTDIDFEGDLGLDSSMSVGRLGGYYWFNDRHRIDVSFFDLSREANRRIDKTINFGDQTYQINTVVTTTNDLTISKIDYTWAFLERDRGYLGVGGGLYVAKTSTSLSEPTLGKFESESLTAPLPVLGFSGDYMFGDHFTLRGAAQWFGITIDNISGRLVDAYVGADYRFTKRVAVGLAYDNVTMKIEAT